MPPITPGLDALKHVSIEELLIPILIQLAVIITVARLFALIGRRLGQPAAVGEIVAGLVLGPSVLQRLAPDLWAALFQPGLLHVPAELSAVVFDKTFAVLSQLGLIFLLFLIGLEFDFSHLRQHGRAALGISFAGVALPFALGLGLAPLLHPHIEPHPQTGQPVPPLGFALFLGVALSITAIPILGRMMMELNINRTRLGAITISAAAADDAAGWILLASVAGIVRSGFAWAGALRMIGETVGFALLILIVARPLLRRWARWALKRDGGELGLNGLAVLLAVMFLCSIATGLIGIFAIFGAFLLGAALSAEEQFRAAAAGKLRDFVTAFFLPIFFTSTGLRTNIGTLESPALWGWAALVLAAAVVGKFGGCGLAARLGGFSPRESACIGVMMNTRALMELIVINLGYELRVIPPSVFCMLVLMALITTVMTTPILLRLMPGTELEPYIQASSFRRSTTKGPVC